MNDDDLPDLQAWRVPPPRALDPRDVVLRALTPATAPVRRTRLRWLIASAVLINAALAALVIVLVRRPAPQTAVVVAPAGGSSTDVRVHELLARLAEEQSQLEQKLSELEQMRALVLELNNKVTSCEQQRTVQRAPLHVTEPAPGPTVVAPSPTPVAPVIDESCDEVSCVLQDYPSGCCDKFKKTAPPPGPPESLGRAAISRGVASVKSAIAACTSTSSAKGVVKVHVRVAGSGLVTNVDVVETPDPVLGACVAAALHKAVFLPSKQGGSFSYPFVF